MEESANRYFLVMFVKKVEKTFVSKEDLEDFFKDYNKKNRDKRNSYVASKPKTKHKSEENIWVVEFSVYKKITVASTLSNIDCVISEKYGFKNQKELKRFYADFVKGGKGDLHIGYMHNGNLKLLPVAYSKDMIFVNYDMLLKFMLNHADDKEFVFELWETPKLKEIEYKKESIYSKKRLHESYGRYWFGEQNLEEIKDNIKKFVEAWCTADNKINQRLVRTLGYMVKDAALKTGTEINIDGSESMQLTINKKA